jgi:hypothetical protein
MSSSGSSILLRRADRLSVEAPHPLAGGNKEVIAMNATWVAGSVLLLPSGWIAPNGLGYALLIGQALAVAVLAQMQYIGLQKSVSAVA